METINESPFCVEVLRIDLGRPEVAAAVIVKSTFDLGPRGRLAVAPEQVPLVKQALETPYGILHSEYFFKKQGVDLCVMGSVRRAKPIEEARVQLTTGARSWDLVVRGDRYWRRAGADRLVPSRPAPFTVMPLAYSHAFGGKVVLGDLSAGYPANPQGRGYYLTAGVAENQLLCNIEDAHAALSSVWRPDEQRPAGWGPYPNFWGLRGATAVQRDSKTGEMESVSVSVFNHAHPDLVLDRAPTGEQVAVDGLIEERIDFRIPASPAVVDVTIAGNRLEVEAPIDGLFLWVDERKLVVTQRARFRYARRPEESRVVRIRATA